MTLHEGYFPSMHELKLDRETIDRFASVTKKQETEENNKHVLFGRNLFSPTMGAAGRDEKLAKKLRDKHHIAAIELEQDTKKLTTLATKFINVITSQKGNGNNKDSKIAKTKHVTQKLIVEHDKKQLETLNALIERGFGYDDLNDDNYHRAMYNPDTFSFWFPRLLLATKSQTFFKIPATSYLTLPMSIMQYLHHDWSTETNQKSRDALNQLLFKKFKLDENTDYFFKTGLFSGKFEFQNSHIDDPKAIGDYLHVVSNQAQMVGAAASNDMVIREWIPDPENRPTIYDGMPLRTEFRAFIDTDLHRVIDVVPYWNNDKVENAIKMMKKTHIGNSNMAQDVKAYAKAKPVLDAEFTADKQTVIDQLQPIVGKLPLSGCWSLDVMKSGHDYYIIDMATMATSALIDTADVNKLAYDLQLRKANGLPAVMPFETAWKFADTPEEIIAANAKLPQPVEQPKLEN